MNRLIAARFQGAPIEAVVIEVREGREDVYRGRAGYRFEEYVSPGAVAPDLRACIGLPVTVIADDDARGLAVFARLMDFEPGSARLVTPDRALVIEPGRSEEWSLNDC